MNAPDPITELTAPAPPPHERINHHAEPPAPVLPLALADLHPSPTNPRRTFAPGPLADLADTIRRHGVLQPILVRPWPTGYRTISDTARYEIVAGERRYRASLLAEQATIVATVRELSDTDVLEIQTIENLQREDVHPLEEAEGYQVLMLRTHYTAEDIAQKLGKSKAYIYARLKLCATTGEARAAFLEGRLSASVALLIARIPVPGLQQRATKEVLQGHGFGGDSMTARQAADHIQRRYMLKLAEAPFPRGDAKLLEGAPKCHACPKRTGNAPELFADVKSADVCTDPECWGNKREAWKDRQTAIAEAAGKRVITGSAATKIAPYGFAEYTQKIGEGLAYLDALAIGVPANAKGVTPTWRQLLGEDCPVATTVIEDTRKGTLHDAAKLVDLRAAAGAKGIQIGSQRGDPATADEREREKVAREQTALRRELVEQIVARSDGEMLSLDELRAITAITFERMDFENQKLACRMWGDDGKIERSHTYALRADILEMQVDDINRMLRLLTFVGSVRVSSWTQTPTKIPAEILDACSHWGIDVRHMQDSIAGAKKPGKLYRHTDRESGATRSWTGRGKRPVWVAEYLADGGALGDLEVVE